MEKVGVAFFNALAKIGVAYIVAAAIVGADALIPHKYVVRNPLFRMGKSNFNQND